MIFLRTVFALLAAASPVVFALRALADPIDPFADGTLGADATRISSDVPLPTPDAPNIPTHHGYCGIHIRQVFGDPHGSFTGERDIRAGNMTAYILDAKHYVLGSLPQTRFTYDNKPGVDESTVAMSSHLPMTMLITMEGEGKINAHSHKNMVVKFAYGGDEWSSDNKERCRVGGVESIKIYSFFLFANRRKPIAWTREMDCGFAC